jgi:hypothetical protein
MARALHEPLFFYAVRQNFRAKNLFVQGRLAA